MENFFEAAPPVPYAASDLAELARLLPAAGYNPEKTFFLSGTRTTKAAIESHLTRLPKLIAKTDSLLVVIAGRAFSQKGSGYLLCSDSILPDLTGTAISISDLISALHRTKCREITVLLDLDPLTIAGNLVPLGLDVGELKAIVEKSPSTAVLLSTEPGERSYEAAQLRRGIWRHHVIESFAGKVRTALDKEGRLTPASLQTYLEEAIPRTLRRTYETPQTQLPRLFGEANAGTVIADLSQVLEPEGEVLDPGRMKRVVFRAESVSRIKDLMGYRKSHSIPDRANEWARKYVNRIATADIKADLDEMFDRIREQFGYKRKDLDVSAERDGLGFIRAPEFEYTVSLSVSPEDPSEVVWRREISRLSGAEFVKSSGFQTVFGSLFDCLVFEFAQRVDVGDLVDRLEENPIEGVKLAVASDANAAEISLQGFSGKVLLTPEAITIHGRPGHSASLLEQFLAFLRKFSGIGEQKALMG
jgi:hypothetical protein